MPRQRDIPRSFLAIADASTRARLSAMSLIDHLDQQAHLKADAPVRQMYVTAMFEEIAPRYNGFTRWFSFGMDASWKRKLVAAVVRHAPVNASAIRDCACGTGDLSVSLAEAVPTAKVEGVDVAIGMIARAQAHPRVTYRLGDATRLPDADASIDVVSIGYGLRNFPDHRVMLAEVTRVLRPGGIVAILEFTKPAFLPWRWALLGYLWVAGTVCGWWMHRHGPVYSYIAHSIHIFVTRRQLMADCSAAGLVTVHEGSSLAGGMCMLVARKSV